MKIAIIGSGISGLGSVYYLSKDHDIDLYESNSRLGGHTHTHTVTIGDEVANVDSGFIVCNNQNYPNILNLFSELDVLLHKASMSYSFTSENISWSSNDFDKIKTFFDPTKLKLLLGIIRFNSLAKKSTKEKITLFEWLNNNNFSNEFIDSYVLPMAGAIWSSESKNILNFPANTFLRFFNNHGLLKLFNRPTWFSLLNGSKSYIKKIIDRSTINKIYLSADLKIRREKNIVIIENNAKIKSYDTVIFACHANQVKPILIDMTKEEKNTLNLFDYNMNRVVLHTDDSLMPETKNQWSAWNSYKNDDGDYVTYWMNKLQNLEINKNIFVTLGKFKPLESKFTIKNLSYEHISYSFSTLEGQKRIEDIQGLNNTYFVGAHLGYGFHEDGLTSALRISKMISNEKF